MLEEFVKELKNSPYFSKYILNDIEVDDIVGIYIAGSTSLKIEDEDSDYDIVVLTTKALPKTKFFSEYVRLKYKGRPMHWYYDSIDYLFDLTDSDTLDILGKVHFDQFFRAITIYENPKYSELLSKLEAIKAKISTLAGYCFLNAQRPRINKLITQNCILKEDHNKLLYQCCFASYYLTNTPINIDFLRELKRIYWNPVKQEYKDLTIEVLKSGLEYINNNPRDYEKELRELYEQIYK